MSTSKERHEERTARMAAVRAEHGRRERRRRIITVGAVGVTVLALAGATTAVILDARSEQARVVAAAAQPIPEVEETTGLSAEHVEATIAPSALPPLGGDHAPVWQNCGIYDSPVPAENAVHSLEHGAVWVAYRPDLPADQVAELRDQAEGEAYALVSPYPDLAAPVVLTAWGVQLELDDAEDDRIPAFLTRYLQGEQTPEPGASCSGGNGTPVG
ncbi:DUF3105 domain-containing protein [Georgenia muralis]|uniref:Uncharacterized protein DUF3105 n=1 Tax=Georgenia muralis TaxID=154117 RepID=A0A3N4Z399_9MICO|nr:DUF3105 domain-containing protein [Georgenia muralis]RPF26983.1 uncharacterized protein DUF3105 [Georgenia muralis]